MLAETLPTKTYCKGVIPKPDWRWTLRVCSFTNFKFDERDIYLLWTLHATEATLGLMERGHWGVWYFATMAGKRFDSLCALLSHEQQRQWQTRSFIMGRPLTDPILWGTDIAFDHTLSELWCFHDIKVYRLLYLLYDDIRWPQTVGYQLRFLAMVKSHSAAKLAIPSAGCSFFIQVSPISSKVHTDGFQELL